MGAIVRFLMPLLLLQGSVLIFGVLGGCGGERPAPYLESSAESEGISADRILFSTRLPGDYSGDRFLDHYTLYTVNADSTKLTKLLELDGACRGALSPEPLLFHLSPDGNRVAFFSTDGYLSVLRIGSGEVTRVVEAFGPNVAWSPDGTKIAYTSGGDLYVVNTHGSDNKKLAEHKSARYHEIGEIEGYIHMPIWSADGKRILFDNFTAPQFLFGGTALDVRNRCIYAVDIATTDIQVLQTMAEICGPGRNTGEIQVKAYRKEDGSRVNQWLVMNDDGGICSECRLTFGKWSPDGNAIANTTVVGDKLYVRDVITGDDIEAEIEGVSDFIWSPDGQHIAYVSGDESHDEIHIVRRDLSHGFLVCQALGPGEDEKKQYVKLITWLSQE